jgi:hypothetical protein
VGLLTILLEIDLFIETPLFAAWRNLQIIYYQHNAQRLRIVNAYKKAKRFSRKYSEP